jgi:hypothetical protein
MNRTSEGPNQTTDNSQNRSRMFSSTRAAGGDVRSRPPMQVRLLAPRGSIAVPEPTTVRYGGNTACLEVCSAGGILIVLDCGTGALGWAKG